MFNDPLSCAAINQPLSSEAGGGEEKVGGGERQSDEDRGRDKGEGEAVLSAAALLSSAQDMTLIGPNLHQSSFPMPCHQHLQGFDELRQHRGRGKRGRGCAKLGGTCPSFFFFFFALFFRGLPPHASFCFRLGRPTFPISRRSKNAQPGLSNGKSISRFAARKAKKKKRRPHSLALRSLTHSLPHSNGEKHTKVQ